MMISEETHVQLYASGYLYYTSQENINEEEAGKNILTRMDESKLCNEKGDKSIGKKRNIYQLG